MASITLIKSGIKMKMALDQHNSGDVKFDFICTFVRALDESAFLISIPMVNGQRLPLNESQKLIFKYGEGENAIVLAGYADGVEKQGIRSYWKIRTVSEQRTFVQRKHERYRVALPIKVYQLTWKPDENGRIIPEQCLSNDISTGGLALYLNRRFEVSENICLEFPALGADCVKLEPQVAVVCWIRETPKGSPYRLLCGVQINYKDGSDRELTQEYINYVKEKYKLLSMR